MRRINKSENVPAVLTSVAATVAVNTHRAKVQAGTKVKSKDFDGSIYGAENVRTQLNKDQNNKCAYCETTLLDKGGGEVEHYRPKTEYRPSKIPGSTKAPAYYWLAYSWDNLLCSCHECNRRKGTFFPLTHECNRDITGESTALEEPILINPCVDDPSSQVEFRLFEIFPKRDENGYDSQRGQVTIDALELNRQDLVELRKRRWAKFQRDKKSMGLDYDGMFKYLCDGEIDEGRSKEDIEFLGMFENQVFKE